MVARDYRRNQLADRPIAFHGDLRTGRRVIMADRFSVERRRKSG
jgi:hypothetical protein